MWQTMHLVTWRVSGLQLKSTKCTFMQTDVVSSPFAVWVRDALEVAFDQVRRHSGLAVQRQKRLYDQRAVRRLFSIGNWVMRYYPAAKKCKLDSVWVGPSLEVSIIGWEVGIQKHLDYPVLLIYCQDVKKVPQPSGMRTWITTPPPVSAPTVPVLGASTVAHTSQGSPSVDVLPPDEGVVLADVDLMIRGWVCRRALSPRRASLSRPLFFGLMGPVSYTHLRYTNWMRALFG